VLLSLLGRQILFGVRKISGMIDVMSFSGCVIFTVGCVIFTVATTKSAGSLQHYE